MNGHDTFGHSAHLKSIPSLVDTAAASASLHVALSKPNFHPIAST